MKIKTKRGARRIRNQRVILKRFVVTDYDGCSYVTAGKLYALTRYGETGESVVSDHGVKIEVTLSHWSFNCSHLNNAAQWRYAVI